MNPIAMVKAVGLDALLFGVMALIAGFQAHEMAPQALKSAPAVSATAPASPMGTLTIGTASSRGGNVIFYAGKCHGRALKQLPTWGVKFKTARGENLLQLDPDGSVYLYDVFIERDPMVLRTFAAWFATAMRTRPGDGAYLNISAGLGWPRDDRELDGEVHFESAGASLRFDSYGLARGAVNPYSEFRAWLDDAVPPRRAREALEPSRWYVRE